MAHNLLSTIRSFHHLVCAPLGLFTIWSVHHWACSPFGLFTITSAGKRRHHRLAQQTPGATAEPSWAQHQPSQHRRGVDAEVQHGQEVIDLVGSPEVPGECFGACLNFC